MLYTCNIFLWFQLYHFPCNVSYTVYSTDIKHLALQYNLTLLQVSCSLKSSSHFKKCFLVFFHYFDSKHLYTLLLSEYPKSIQFRFLVVNLYMSGFTVLTGYFKSKTITCAKFDLCPNHISNGVLNWIELLIIHLCRKFSMETATNQNLLLRSVSFNMVHVIFNKNGSFFQPSHFIEGCRWLFSDSGLHIIEDNLQIHMNITLILDHFSRLWW